MLPSSHFVLINSEAEELRRSLDCPIQDRMEDERSNRSAATLQLASAFSEFISASSLLENSYRRLQEEVAELRVELANRNAALQLSFAENESIHRSLEQIVSSMPCGVLVLDEDGAISLANPESRHLLGLQAACSESEILNVVGVSEATQIDLHRLVELATNQESIHEMGIRREGKVCWLEVRIRRFQDSSADIREATQAIVILRDITAKKHAEQERELGRRAFAMAEVSSEVAHEIRNPLAALELFAELIERDEAERSTWISHLRAGIRSLSATVNNVLSLRSGTFKLEIINLSDAVDSALSFARPLLAQAELTVRWKSSVENQSVLASVAAIQQIVLNLVTNAIRHTPAGGGIDIHLSQHKGVQGGVTSEYLVFQFADSGTGIPPAHLDRIFDPGFSGSGATSGLGLTVCERIMREHGGTITAGNRIGGGAQFNLVFPAYREGASA